MSSPENTNTASQTETTTTIAKGGKNSSIYSEMLKNQLLGVNSGNEEPKNVFRFHAQQTPLEEASNEAVERRCAKLSSERSSRRIPRKPFKVLDAPSLQDDFYLNVVSWSAQNILAVGLGSQVFLWNAATSKVVKLTDLAPQDDSVASVEWDANGSFLAVGTGSGEVQIYDVARAGKVRSIKQHEGRVGALAWNGMSHQHVLASGSRDRIIHVRDMRDSSHSSPPYSSSSSSSSSSSLAATGGTASSQLVLSGHKQEVCGLKWSFDDSFLASGGNDNALMVWRHGSSFPLARFEHHSAAVKALAWSPHQSGLLASGGGTADRCIRFWNTSNLTQLHHIDTGSQICNIAWSKNVNELVSTHGYSQNQVIVWKYPSMSKLCTLSGHTLRVLYLSISPDGETIVTGAGDETLRFWNVFPSAANKQSGKEGNVLWQHSHASIR